MGEFHLRNSCFKEEERVGGEGEGRIKEEAIRVDIEEGKVIVEDEETSRRKESEG
jgi:hypothetical protein